MLPGMHPAQSQDTSPPDKVIIHRGVRYVLGERIGRGHFSTVVACTDEWGNRLAAKIMAPDTAVSSADFRLAWSRELKNLVALRHPNITYIHAAFEDEGRYFLIVERCSLNFKKFVASLKGDREHLLDPVAGGLLRAVHFIHGAGYVHRDLHPQNVLVQLPAGGSGPVVKVGDLGICRLEKELYAGKDVSPPVHWVLPPEYLDPAKFGRYGRQADIFHAALLLMSLLRGEIARFTNQQVMADEPRRMAETLPSPHAPAIARALRARVADRTPSALAFWRDLSGR